MSLRLNQILGGADIRSPIFYDSNDTNYYIDAASTPLLNATRSVSVVAGSNSAMTGSPGSLAVYSASSPYISFHDGGVARTAYIQEAGGRFYFGDIPYTESEGSFRAPLFYDVNDTAYYCDPASTSRLNILSVGTGAILINGAGTATDRNLKVKGASSTNVGIVLYDSSDNFRCQLYGESGSYGFLDGVWAGWDLRKSVGGSLFLNNNNTYYLNPASTTNLNNLTVAGTMTFGTLAYVTESRRSKNSSNVDIETVTGLVSPSGPTFLEIRGFCPPTMYRTTGDRPAPYGLGFGNGSESGGIMPIGAGDNLQEIMLYGANSGPTTFTFKRQIWEAATYDPSYSNYYGSAVFSINTGTGAVTASTDIRSPIFYDNNDTSYYIDPASTSVINILQFAANTAQIIGNTSSSYGSLDIRGVRNGWRGIHFNAGGNAPHLMFDGSANGGVYFETGGRWASYYSYGNNCWGFGTSTTSSAYNIYVGTGIYSGGRVDGTIFYDSNDTTYYVDPASTSRLVALWVRGSSETAGNIYVGGTAAGDRLNINYDQIWTPNGNLHLQYSGGGNIDMNYGGGFTFSRTSLRAPIFYDYNDTNYYADPASTSVFNRLKVDGGNFVNDYFQSISDFTNGTLVTTDIDASVASGESFVMNVVGKSYSASASPFNFSVQGYLYNSTIINYSGLSLDSTGLSTIKIFNNGGFLCFWWARVSYWNAFEVSVRAYNSTKANYNRVTNVTDSTEPVGSKKVTVTLQSFLRADVSATNSVDLRAPIFYDSNDTTYYTDPASTSNILELKTNKNWYDTSASVWGGGINMAGNNPSIGFQSTSSTWWYMLHHSSSNINFYRRSTSGSWNHDGIWDNSGNLIWQGSSVRAPIFYDQNNTAYYCDPASTSNLNAITAAGNVTAAQYYTGGWFRNSSSGNGLYNESTGEHFYSDASDMWNVASSQNTQGIRLRTGGHNGTIRGYFYADSSNNVGLLNNGGNWRVRVVDGDYLLADGSSIRGQIFYDSNNTTYYIDAASTSNLNSLAIAGTLSSAAYNNLANDYKDIYVYGDVNTYYVVLIQGEYIYSYGRYSVTRGYNWTGPDTWYVATHKGGLTLDWEYSGDTAWGGNDQNIRIIEFHETYSTMVAGFALPVNGGVIVWLRGGGVNGALYRIRTPIGANSTVTVYDGVTATNHSSSTSFTAANSAVFSTRANTSNVASEINSRFPVRYAGTLYNDGNAVVDQSGTSQTKSGILSSSASLRAPIFYDTDNTAYYVDPASTSNIVGLTVANTISGSINGTANGLNSSNYISRVGSSGNYNTDFQNTPAGTVRHLGDDANATNNPGGTWWFVDNYRHSNSSNYWGTQVAWGWEDQANKLATRNITGGTFGSWVYYLNSGNYSNYAIARGGDTVDGVIYFRSNKGSTSTVGANNSYQLEAFSSDAGAAGMSFHRGGYYAVNMGLDPDNIMRIGGWSASANRWELDMSGNNWVASSFRAPIFYDSNNTGYYIDAASTSILNLVRTRNTFGERIAVTSAASTTIDTNFNVTELTMSASITTLTLSNIQASTIVHMWTIVTVGNGTAYSITWPAAVKWPGGTAPTITSTNTKRDIYQFVTYDGGTNIYAIIVGQNL